MYSNYKIHFKDSTINVVFDAPIIIFDGDEILLNFDLRLVCDGDSILKRLTISPVHVRREKRSLTKVAL